MDHLLGARTGASNVTHNDFSFALTTPVCLIMLAFVLLLLCWCVLWFTGMAVLLPTQATMVCSARIVMEEQ